MTTHASPTIHSDPTPTAPASEGPSPGVDYYFDSYSHYGIHMEMLKDEHRTCSYRDAILMNRAMFEGRVVLDVGCGTGILSLFAARAGAKRVIAVDCSTIATQAKEIVRINGFESVIEVHAGKLEDLKLDVPVDIIISEWMGYFLLYESMLNSVLYARDHFGVPNHTKLLPSHAAMFICAINDESYMESKFDVWNNVEGLDYSYFKRLSFLEPQIDTVNPSQVATNTTMLITFDLQTVKEEELAFSREVKLVANRRDTVHALSVHFETPFSAGHEMVTLSTSPYARSTHWRQTVLYLCNDIAVETGEAIHLRLACRPNHRNKRDLDLTVEIDFKGARQVSHFTQEYRLR